MVRNREPALQPWSNPPLEKAAQLQGKVVLKATISPAGAIVTLEVKEGDPILIPAAVEAAKRRQYKPFIVDGHPAEVVTNIEVPLGLPDGEMTRMQEAANAYYKQEGKCRDLVHAKQYGDAELSCNNAVELVEKLPPERTEDGI
jgi:hypothetical protein